MQKKGEAFKAFIALHIEFSNKQVEGKNGRQKKITFGEGSFAYGRYVGLKSTERLGESFDAFILEKYYSPFL